MNNIVDAYNLFHNGMLAFNKASEYGICIDVKYCEKKKELLTKKIGRLESQFKSTKFYRRWEHLYGNKTNIGSDTQLGNLLYGTLGKKPVKLTETGKGGTDEESLRALEIPELDIRIKIKRYEKARDTYLDAYLREQVDGKIHPFFNLHTTRTYRPSTDHPNLANVPIRDEEMMAIIRRAIIPRKGYQLFEPDFSGVEVRIACCYTQDPKLIEDTLHGDMHRDMAIELYMLDSLDKTFKGEYYLRQGGKNGFVFPEFYGDYHGNCFVYLLDWAKKATLKNGTPALVHLKDKGLIKLTKDGKIRNSDKFAKHVENVEDDFWNVRYRVYTKWKEDSWRRYQKRGYVKMKTGFKMSGVMSKNQVLNGQIQGSAFHCLLWSFIRVMDISEKEYWKTKLVNQVYDSFLFDTHPSELKNVANTIKRVACVELPNAWSWINIPIDLDADICEVDEPWSRKHAYKFEEKETQDWPGPKLKRAIGELR